MALGAEHVGLRPLSSFAPYRVGASTEPSVMSERSRGLCRFLENVLRITEEPASKALARLADEFILRHWHQNGKHEGVDIYESMYTRADAPRHSLANTEVRSVQPLPTSDVAQPFDVACGSKQPKQRAHTADAHRRAPRKVCAWWAQETRCVRGKCCGADEDTSYVKPASGVATLPAAKVLQESNGIHDQLPRKVWHDAIAPLTRPSNKPFIMQIQRCDVGNGPCPLCWKTLRDQGCVRFRSCGHEVHSSCLNDLLRGGRFRGILRSACPTCGELWAEWGLASARGTRLDGIAPAGVAPALPS